MTVKLVVIYPRPKDVEAFETVYNREHVPMAVLATRPSARLELERSLCRAGLAILRLIPTPTKFATPSADNERDAQATGQNQPPDQTQVSDQHTCAREKGCGEVSG